ncbi:MAG TPA: MMPL family transporter, partial [Streptosporangiaceae bacterium]
MNSLLERVAAVAVRRHWIVIAAWLVILGGLLGASRAWGGTYVNNYTVSGTESADGLDRLNAQYPQQGGYAGQIVFSARHGATVTSQQPAVNQATSNLGKLPHVIKAASPFASSSSGAVSKNGEIAYASVTWKVNPNSLGTSYLDRMNTAVEPARRAGLTVDYGAGAGQIGQTTDDITSEAIGLGCALILLILMFGSLVTAAVPLLSAIFSVGSGLALLALIAAGVTFPTTAPTIATLLGLGVAVDYGLFLVSRHREHLDSGMSVADSAVHAQGTSGAAIVVAGTTVVISILGLYVVGVSFVGSLGLAAAVVVAVTMLAALTMVPALLGLIGGNARALSARLRARKEGVSVREQARESAAAT